MESKGNTWGETLSKELQTLSSKLLHVTQNF